MNWLRIFSCGYVLSRFCEINSEDVPHLIVKDSSDMWKTNTLLKLPLQKAEDDELMVHMVDLCTERKVSQ